jgi:hypothetical protein
MQYLIIDILYFICFLTGVYACFFFRPFYFKLVIALLFITILNELIIAPYITKKFTLYDRNIAYNIFSLIDMTVFFYIFFKIHIGSIRKYILGAIVLVYIYSFVELFFLKGWRYFHTDSFSVYEIVIILLSLLYLYKLLKKEYYIAVIDPIFWLCSACLIYHSILIINFTTKADENYWRLKNALSVYILLQYIANISYYLILCCMFISGIYYSNWQKKKASSRE